MPTVDANGRLGKLQTDSLQRKESVMMSRRASASHADITETLSPRARRG